MQKYALIIFEMKIYKVFVKHVSKQILNNMQNKYQDTL